MSFFDGIPFHIFQATFHASLLLQRLLIRTPLTTVLHDGSYQLAIPNHTLHLLRNRLLLEITLFACGNRDVQAADPACDNFNSVQTLFAQVDIARVGLLDIEGRAHAENLGGEGRRGGDADLRDNRVQQDGSSMTVEHADGVHFALDLNDSVLASKQIHCLVDRSILNNDRAIRVFVVFLKADT